MHLKALTETKITPKASEASEVFSCLYVDTGFTNAYEIKRQAYLMKIGLLFSSIVIDPVKEKKITTFSSRNVFLKCIPTL